MTKPPAELAVMRDIEDRYRHDFRRLPGLAEQILGHVDEGLPLVHGMEMPTEQIGCDTVYRLLHFKNAHQRRQAMMVELAREHISQQNES